jgi:hypothetical protein
MVFAASSVLIILFCGRDAETHDRRRIRSRVAAVMAVQLACISPLFILGVDCGRWLFLWLASTAMVCTLRPVPPCWLDAGFARLYNTRVAERISGWLPARDWYLLVFGVPVCWNLHNFLTASPLGRHIDLIRSWF